MLQANGARSEKNQRYREILSAKEIELVAVW